MILKLKTVKHAFLRSEEGAVTVDWVVLTSAVIGLGVAVLITIASGAKTYATTLNSDVEAINVMQH